MDSSNKCPISAIKQSQLWTVIGGFIGSIKNHIDKLTGNEPFTYKFWREYLGIKNIKKELDDKFKNMSISEMEQVFESNDEWEQNLLCKYINNHISVFVFQKMIPEIQKMNHHLEWYDQYQNLNEYMNECIMKGLIHEISLIAQNILDIFYEEVRSWNDSYIHNIFRLQNKVFETTEISENLRGTFFRDGIQGIIYRACKELKILVDHSMLPILSNTQQPLNNLESTWKDFALSNIATLYIGSYDGQVMNGSWNELTWSKKHSFEKKFSEYAFVPSHSTILPDLTKKQFQKAVHTVLKVSWKIESNNLGLWCPILFTTAQDPNWESVNGITAYQRTLYKIMFDGMYGYVKYEQEVSD